MLNWNKGNKGKTIACAYVCIWEKPQDKKYQDDYIWSKKIWAWVLSLPVINNLTMANEDI